jgi:hypothetical protein
LRSIMVLGLQQVQKNGFHGLYHFFLCVWPWTRYCSISGIRHIPFN